MNYDEMQSFIRANRGKSREELMDMLSREYRGQGEQGGTKMEEIYEMLHPMLTPEQRRKMREVIGRLKN